MTSTKMTVQKIFQIQRSNLIFAVSTKKENLLLAHYSLRRQLKIFKQDSADKQTKSNNSKRKYETRLFIRN